MTSRSRSRSSRPTWARWSRRPSGPSGSEARGRRIASNRFVYSLSIAVYATTWTFYGSIGFAARNGLLFLSVYLGPTLCAIAWWWLLRGLIRLKESHRIMGLAGSALAPLREVAAGRTRS